MSEIHLNIHMPYSWWRKAPGLMMPDKNQLPVYLAALKKELASLGEDLREHTVKAVHFEGGYMGLLVPDDFEEMMAAIHSSFRLTQGCEISGMLFPGSLDMALISAYRNYHAGPLMFEVPSLLMRECERYQLPNVQQLLEHTAYMMQSYQESNWGMCIARGIPGRNAEAWKHLALEALHYQPSHISFFDIAPAADDGFEACTQELCRRGFHAVTDTFYTCRADAPEYLRPAETAAVGLGAVSTLDGFRTRNTDDMKRYLNCCTDYRNLLVEVTELS